MAREVDMVAQHHQSRGRLITVLVWLAAILLTTSPALAQDSKQLTVGGVRGRWFPMETAGALLQDHVQLEGLTRRVVKLQYDYNMLNETTRARLSLRDRELSLCADQLALSKTAIFEIKQDLGAAQLSLRVAESEVAAMRVKSAAWYRHPVTWLAVGFLTAGVSVFLLAK